ncbi:MAG: DNA-binding transcriptional LysR family regulator [Myxococcota bacterium]|jgi:DNA-binding transcriptional LysR family regulator
MRICMDWRSVRFDWNRARAFLVTAEEGSFSAAARSLGLSQPTVGRQVAALEEELGLTLFDRAHGLALTPAGMELVEHVRAMGEAATRVSLAATGQSTALDGTVCISASEVVSVFLLPPIIQRIRELHPRIELELVATNATSDLRRREADIAVRSFRPTTPDLVARRIRDDEARLYASPAYLERVGNPDTPTALSAAAELIGFDRSPALIDGLNHLGLSLTPANVRIVTQNQMVHWELTKRGVGMSIMLCVVGDAEPSVVRALPSLPPFPVPMWLVTHRELSTNLRMRVVFDLLAEGLAPTPAA